MAIANVVADTFRAKSISGRAGFESQNAMANLINALHRPNFADICLDSISKVSHFDSAVIMAYGVGPTPRILYDQLAEEYRDAFYDRYLKGAFILSPLYQSYKNNGKGFFHIDEVAPEGFFKSEYHKKYYCYSGLIDQVFYLKQFSAGVAIVLSLARTNKLRPYSQQEIADLKAIEPTLMALLAKNWEKLASDEHNFYDYLHKAFENFGRSVLSRREKDAVNCMLRGSSSKSAAREMGISTETERSYRKTIYNKLNVCSHSEIYHLFFKSLEFADSGEDCDPLELLWNSAK
ncbi:LuxR family transcriptional regulator [Dasania sp. GY-MA-18]|uniref:LuxR family transcriptional regulator n=1 Tax=Dasania phycosphaerae TaxID=2950436 RepID=A0A9J6RK33_9GAMM|nr:MULTISPECIES: LuxR family transcriptional regulator [Dasania]MCR8922624.1 LuxR family transcriptional regulator [Dasania sp. GY-MA-18]MCZ0865054.1 LuxR family transcriptional regulator [Dasania phycosphaerae]MCZ0868780.1 LuxR family transcriptional regulator [Dasania phycosphaerae]